MPKILYADNDYPEIDIERALFEPAGVEIVQGQCRTEDQVIALGKDCCGILLQYAPIGAKVVAALPRLGIVSRIGAGFDTVDTDACAAAGVWVANSPDYGVGEVATHALALALASIRNIVAYDRDIHAGQWSFMSPGTMRRPSELTLGIVGLGRIGKRMAHISRNVFKRVVAYDPHIIDGDFPAYVERAASLAALAGQSDVVSLHTPLNAETRGLVDAKFFAAVRRGAFFVNTSRGAVVEPARPGRCARVWACWPARRSTSCPRSRCRATRHCSSTRARFSRRTPRSTRSRRKRSCGARRHRTSSRGLRPASRNTSSPAERARP